MPKINLLTEEGQSGLVQFQGLVSESYTSKLEWPGAYDIYNEMRRRDPTVRTLWNALILLARTASWYVEPGGEGADGARAANHLTACVEGMSHTIEDYVEDALTCALFGWSWLELVYKRLDDGSIGWQKWAMRRQSSFERWEFDEAGGVQGMVQRPAPDYREREIKIGKSLHFTNQRDGGNPEGFPLLESSYEIWYYVKNLQIINGIGWQRTFVGVPHFEVEEQLSPDDEAKVKEVGEGLQVDEKQYALTPPGVKLSLLTAQNSGAAALLDTIRYYRLLMLQTLLADFIDLGTGQTGSWALGSDKSQLFLMAVDGFLDRIGSVINRFGVERMFEYNTGLARLPRPRLRHTPVEKPALAQLGSWLQQVSGLLTWGPEDERWIRERTGMPVLQEGVGSRGVGSRGVGSRGVGSREEGETRREGELAELAEVEGLAAIEGGFTEEMAAILAAQQERVVGAVERNPGLVDDEQFWTDEIEVLSGEVLGKLTGHIDELVALAISTLTAQVGGGADWTTVNTGAVAWARAHVGELIGNVIKTTKASVREAVAAWIEAGAKLDDLTDVLAPIFGRRRAALIGATEVTRAFDQANDLARQAVGLPAAEMLAPAHPACRCGTRPMLLPNGEWVIVWYTVKGDLVCKQPLDTPWGTVAGCQGLDGVIVSQNYLGRSLGEIEAEVR